MKKICTLFTILFAFTYSLSAQDYVLLSGQIIDQKTREAILYAHIGIPEKGIGTTSGHDGSYIFKVPRQYANSTLMISHMGYKTYHISIDKITVPFTVELERSPYNLTEIVVTDGSDAEAIIRKAVKAIPENYPTHPTRYLAFYRESCTDDSLQYRYMAEGVLNIYKHSYTSDKEGQVSLVQGRSMNFKNPLDTIIRGGLGSGHMAAHRFDIVQNREDFLNEAYFPVYKYWIERTTTYNDKPVYVIAFAKDENPDKVGKQKKKKSGFLKSLRNKVKVIKGEAPAEISARLEGRVFIDMNTYAIIRAEFEVTNEGLQKSMDYPLYSGNWRANNYIVNYRQLDGKWYFSDALREGNLRGALYNNEIKTTEIFTEKADPIPYQERLYQSQLFARMTGTYDPDFWTSYNTVPLSEALTEQVRQMENNRKAAEVFKPERMLALQQQRDSIRLARIRQAEMERAQHVGEEGEVLAKTSEIDFSETRTQSKKRGRYSRVNLLLGVGTQLVSSGEDNLSLTYFSKNNESTILTFEGGIPKRRFEVISNLDLDIYFRRHFFVRMGMNWDYLNSIYKSRSIGLGSSWNLSKQRPVFFKAIAQYENWKYARKMGVADNDYGKFEVRGKKFNSKSVNLYYGSRTHNLKLSSELSVELNPDREFYVRGNWHFPFAQRKDVWFKERRQLFRKKQSLPIDDSKLLLTQGELLFDKALPEQATFSIAVGWLFK